MLPKLLYPWYPPNMEGAAAAAGGDGGAAPRAEQGEQGLPPGIRPYKKTTRFYVRLPGYKVDGKASQRPIPGTFKDIPAALAAQAEAQLKLKAGGTLAVWPTEAPDPSRNARGTVRRAPHTVLPRPPCAVRALP